MAGAILVTIGATLLPLASQSIGDGRARMNDTRQQATRWAVRNVPSGSSVIIEHFAFDIVDAPWRILFPMGDAGCVDAKAMLQGKISYSLVEASRETVPILIMAQLPGTGRGHAIPSTRFSPNMIAIVRSRAIFPMNMRHINDCWRVEEL